jgi:hypothetical protein
VDKCAILCRDRQQTYDDIRIAGSSPSEAADLAAYILSLKQE